MSPSAVESGDELDELDELENMCCSELDELENMYCSPEATATAVPRRFKTPPKSPAKIPGLEHHSTPTAAG